MQNSYDESVQELLRAIKRFIFESNERQLETEKKIEELEKEIECILKIDESILETKIERETK